MQPDLNILTVDLEEWYVAEALATLLSRDEWASLPSTVEKNTRILLDLFDHKNVSATFFILGWCADQHPELMREISDRGHEIACHSYYHRRVSTLDAATFREDTVKAVAAITNASGVKPKGYRAPSWSMNDSTPWAFQTLSELGFEYDSSIFPIKHDIYGMPHGPRHMFRMQFDENKILYEIPASTFRLFGKNLPIGGGGFLRHSPYWYTRQQIRKLNKAGHPVIVYIHPWEVDNNPPRVHNLSAIQRFRSYGSTAHVVPKLARLLDDFEFSSMYTYIQQHKRKQIGFR